jgi:transposase, IS30 family
LRPLGAANKTRYGHYEADTIVSKQSKEALSVMYERKAKYASLRKIPNLKPRSNNHAIKYMKQGQKVLSMSFDNGIENTKHYELGIPTYFCDPYSSWQKGGVENLNKMIRQYIPKGSDIAKYLPSDILKIQHKPCITPSSRTPRLFLMVKD